MIQKPSTCQGCPLYTRPHGKPTGWVPAHGSGENGVLLVLEAAGADEEEAGIPVVGKAGYTLFQQLKRHDIDREGFRIHNVLSCRPPDNKLSGMPYEDDAINCCAPNLDATILSHVTLTRNERKTPVIVTLGVVAFRRVMGLPKKHALMGEDYIAYPFWSDKYNCWVLAADHPAYLMRGNTHLWPVLTSVIQRALQIANDGLELEQHQYTLDPDPLAFSRWVDDYVHTLQSNRDLVLSYDIETPYKRKLDESDLAKEEDADHTILRVSFCHTPNEAVSVRWSSEYLADIERLFTSGGQLMGWNSDLYDAPRVRQHVQMTGTQVDAMVAWHILNSSLPKSLGFVTPFYVPRTGMWKHLSEDEPAFYNAKDADMALRNWIGIRNDLKDGKLWDVFDHHVLQLNKALAYMTGKGVLLDSQAREEGEKRLQLLLDGIEETMQAAVPQQARKLKVYKSVPKELKGKSEVDLEGLKESGAWTTVEVPQLVWVCTGCGAINPKKPHFKQKKGTKKKPAEVNPCADALSSHEERVLKLWAKPLDFKISKLGLSNYQKALAHQAIHDRREKKVTFNEDAIIRLMQKYPNDRLYPEILKHREVQKLLSTYVGITMLDGKLRGGMPVGKDNRIHTSYSHNPSTLRLASQDPNLQNLPRPSKDTAALANIVRNLVVASDGHTLYARDYSGIEAVLTGYFAADSKYIRLAKRDIHTYYTVYALYELEGGRRIGAADLPDINWPDDRLFPYLADLKSRFSADRNNLYKHLVHAANFMQSPKGAAEKIFHETRIEYPLKTVTKVMDVYYTLFPSIRRYHRQTLEEAEKEGYLRNPFQYIHRFSRIYDYTKMYGEWEKKPGSDANKAIAFKPQSTAAAIIKEAIIRLFFNRFEEAGKYMRLQVHDEILLEVPENRLELVDVVVSEEMERPIPELKMPLSWGMGECLSINTESKKGRSWGSMK